MSEFDAIERLRQRLASPPAGETWIGDDTAVLPAAGRGWQLLAADTVVEGVHTDLRLLGLADLGWKAVAANISDIAAMGGRPGYAVVTVAAPPGTDLDELYDGIGSAASCYQCPVVGGDLVNAPLVVVTVAVTGAVEGRPVLRSGARPGDRIWVTGPLGRSAAGLRLLQTGAGHGGVPDTGFRLPRSVVPSGLTACGLPEVVAADLLQAHARPRAALAEGTAARLAGATAMIDVSDGFAADLAHLADASDVGFRLDDVPVAEGASVEEALGGGEDYVLVFSAPDSDQVRERFAGLPEPIAVGVIVADRAERSWRGELLAPTGWQHQVT